ncbi:hypothetical protein Ae717Ps2_6607c [Pseudonocardia sp. Ae717_Ps2]|nr:hypothetical protein Ae717Ps2_6607c [Pseudonocardia sp. Ae717_Ps2]
MSLPDTHEQNLAADVAGIELTRQRQLLEEASAADRPAPVSGAARRLAVEAAEAAQVRALSTDPDVVALRIERVRVQVDRLAWSGIVLGLAFTMTNVQAFAAAGQPAWSPTWIAAWALDPMVSLVLIAVLRAEQVTARWQVTPGPWVRRARWTTLAATYVMNTWSAWAAGIPSQVVLHSVPPLVVFVAAEAVTGLREALTLAVLAAAAAGTPPRTAASPGTEGAGGSGGGTPETASAGSTPELPAAPTPDQLEGTPAQAEGFELDPRVRELAELLVAGEPITGAQAGALHAVSARSGRRLLAAAQDAVGAGVVTAGRAGAKGASGGSTPTASASRGDEETDEDEPVLLSVAGWS